MRRVEYQVEYREHGEHRWVLCREGDAIAVWGRPRDAKIHARNLWCRARAVKVTTTVTREIVK